MSLNYEPWPKCFVTTEISHSQFLRPLMFPGGATSPKCSCTAAYWSSQAPSAIAVSHACHVMCQDEIAAKISLWEPDGKRCGCPFLTLKKLIKEGSRTKTLCLPCLTEMSGMTGLMTDDWWWLIMMVFTIHKIKEYVILCMLLPISSVIFNN